MKEQKEYKHFEKQCPKGHWMRLDDPEGKGKQYACCQLPRSEETGLAEAQVD